MVKKDNKFGAFLLGNITGAVAGYLLKQCKQKNSIQLLVNGNPSNQMRLGDRYNISWNFSNAENLDRVAFFNILDNRTLVGYSNNLLPSDATTPVVLNSGGPIPTTTPFTLTILIVLYDFNNLLAKDVLVRSVRVVN